MPSTPAAELFLGCGDQQVRVVIIEDAGNLVLQVFATDPANTDIDALFFNFADGFDTTGLTIFPEFDESIGSNGENVTGFDASVGSLNQLNNGAQIQDNYDVRLEFGTVPYSSAGDVDQAALTFYIDGGGSNLTVDSLDLSTMTAVINSDDGQNGMALVGGFGTTAALAPLTYSEDFFGIHSADQSALIASDDHWAVCNGSLVTNGSNDGTLTFEAQATSGPASLSFVAAAGNLHNFEAGGHYGDSLRVEVSIDGGDYQLLDEFVVNHDNSALVGSNTGQTITGHDGTLTYSGGILDTANESVQFRIVSDISANDELIYIDDVELGVSVPEDEITTEENVVFEETFDSTWNVSAAHAQGVDGWTNWDMRHGELQTDGCDDGCVYFDEVDVDGPATVSFDARAPHTQNFENSGHYADSLEIWAQIDGQQWVLLDTFEVNDEGTALVGDQTGQTITADSQTLTYEGGALDDADTVQLAFYSNISASNEEIYFDNVTITETVETHTPGDGTGTTDPFCDEYAVTYDDMMVNADYNQQQQEETTPEDDMAYGIV